LQDVFFLMSGLWRCDLVPCALLSYLLAFGLLFLCRLRASVAKVPFRSFWLLTNQHCQV
jgi:hypothetical protein